MDNLLYNYYKILISKIIFNIFHSLHLSLTLNGQRLLQCPQLYAVVRVKFKLTIMVFGKCITRFSKVVIFVNHCNIKSFRTWMTMAAINTTSCGISRCKVTYNGIVTFLFCGIKVSQYFFEVVWASEARKNCDNTRVWSSAYCMHWFFDNAWSKWRKLCSRSCPPAKLSER